LLDGYAKIADQALDLQRRQEDSDEYAFWTKSLTKTTEQDDSDDRVFTRTCHRTVRENAIRNGRQLFQRMMKFQEEGSQEQAYAKFMAPDSYTWSTMMRFCETGDQVQEVLQQAMGSNNAFFKDTKSNTQPVAVRAAITGK
jgi:hypothetical protein